MAEKTIDEISDVKKIENQDGSLKRDPFDRLLGDFGRWQLVVFITISFVKICSGWIQMAILFLTPNLKFWCSNMTSNVNTSDIEIETNTCYDSCEKYEYDTSPFDNTIISEWDLVCERMWLASFTQMVLQLGVLVGSIVLGFFSDRYGRKNTFLFSVMTMIVFGLAIPFSPNYIVFTILRFFLGMATSGTMVVSFVIVMEAVSAKYRGLVGCMLQLPFIVGHMTIPLIAYFFRSWDKYTLAMGIPSLIFLGYFFVLTESPRWLVSVGRVDEAVEIVKNAATINRLPTDKVEDTLRTLSNEIISASALKVKPNYSDLFRRSLWLKTICCCYIWLMTGLTFYGFNQYISQTSSDPFISTAAAGAIQIPANLLSIWLISQLGRKLTTITFFVLGGLSIIALGLVPDIFAITLTLGSLGVSFASIVATTIYIYSSELFPTVVRNMGMGVCSTSMRVGSMLAPFVSNMSLTMPWLPTLIFGAAALSAGLVCLTLPETKGRTLQNSLVDPKKEESD